MFAELFANLEQLSAYNTQKVITFDLLYCVKFKITIFKFSNQPTSMYTKILPWVITASIGLKEISFEILPLLSKGHFVTFCLLFAEICPKFANIYANFCDTKSKQLHGANLGPIRV